MKSINNRFLLSKQAAHYVVPKITFVYHKIYIFKKVKSFLNKFKVQRPLHGNIPKRKGSTTVNNVVVHANRTPPPRLLEPTLKQKLDKYFIQLISTDAS